MFASEMHKEAFPLEGYLDDVHPAGDNTHSGCVFACGVCVSDQKSRCSPGEETGANHVTEDSHAP